MVTTKAIAKVAAVATGLAMATSMLSLAPLAHAAALTDAQVSSILSLLTSFGADSSTIANVKASLTGGTPVSTGTTSTASSCSFTKDLTDGATGAEVTCLQQALIAAGYSIPAGATGYFGNQTKTAVIAWQKAMNVAPAVGYFGSISRAHWNLGGGSTTTTTGGTTTTTGGTTATAGTGTGLKVSLAATSPSGSVLVQGQAIGDLADYVFANPTATPINVTGLTFNRTGVSNDSTLTNVYLYNNGTRITDSAGVSASAFSYSDANGIFTVPAGGTYTVSVRSDIAGSTSGQQLGVSLVSVTSNGTLDSSVSFPIASGYQTISAASLAAVDYGTVTPSANTTLSISPQNDYPLWQNTISVSTNPVKLASMKFTNLGSIDSSYVTNLRLYVDGTMVGSAVPTMAADRTVTFDLTAAPYLLSTQSHVVKLLANVTGGASRSIHMSVQRSSDAMFVDNQLGQPVTPTNGGTTFSAITAGTININSVSGSSGVSVSVDPSSPNQSVSVGASNVKWASFDMLASGENTKVNDLYVYAATSVHKGGLKNGKVMVNGVQVGSTKDIVEGSNSGSTYTDFSLGSSLVLPAGQTTVVDIFADAKTSTSTNLTNGETVQVGLYGSSSIANAQGQSSLNSANIPASPTDALSISVSSSALTATMYSGYGSQTIIAGAQSAKLGEFTLSSGSTEGVTVNTISIALSGTSSASITNLTLKDAATGATLGSVITTPSSTNSFAVTLDVPASQTKTVEIFGNILSGANVGPITATVGTGTTGTGDSTGIAASVASPGVALQTITVGTGVLTVTRGANDPTSNNVLAGASSVAVGEFNFAAQNSSYTVQNIAVLVPSNAATAVTNVTVSYKDVNGATQTATQALTLPSTTQGYATATFTGLSMYVPANDSANLDVSVGTPTVANAGANISGAAINVTLDDGNGTNLFRAINNAGSPLALFNSNNVNVASNGTFYVRKSIPTFAMVPTGNTVPSTGSVLYKFTISADAAGAIEWTKLTFNVATSSSGGSTNVTAMYLTDDSTGVSLLNTNVNPQGVTGSQKATIDLSKNSTLANYAQVGAGATKTYDLYGTVAGYTTGSTVTLSLAADSTATTSAPSSNFVTENTVWSDRSASAHATSTADWTNGYLLKNFTSTAVSYSK